MLIPNGEMRRVSDCRVLKREGLQIQNTRRALGYLIDHVPVRVIHEGLATCEMMNTRTVRRRLDREGLVWDAQKGGTMRTQFANKVQGLIQEPWVEQMLSKGQGAVYDHLTARRWEMEGDIYGIQPSDHKYGHTTTDALQHKYKRGLQ